MKITNDVLAVLSECSTDGNVLYLPSIQLERKLYEAVNKCLTNIGGKWNRSKKGHVFDYAPADALDNLLLTGETEDLKKKFQFFPTPRNIAELMCELAELTADSRVLEPSCGKGDLADVIYEQGVAALTGIELNPDMDKYLSEKPYRTILNLDFLEFVEIFSEAKNHWSNELTHIIMNPPFARQQDIDHIRAAFDVLNSGGILVSVVSMSPFFRTNKKSADFRDWLAENNADIIDVPAGAFKASGTNIPTKIIKIVKGG
jgi:predicted RNA methylase